MPKLVLIAPRSLVLAIFLLVFGAMSVPAQTRLHLWDVPLGIPVSALPRSIFFEPSCGTNGGPQGLPIHVFSAFADCPAEPSGLREVWFTFDDTLEYIGRALRDDNLIGRNLANQVGGHPVVFSFLVDDDGRVAGYRIVTDDRAEPGQRLEAITVAAFFRARMGSDWNCQDLPAMDGETPIEGTFVKRLCVIETDQLIATLDMRYYFRRGQQPIDPQGRPMENAFESSARLEVLRNPEAPLPDNTPIIAEPPIPEAHVGDAVGAFLAGTSVNCSGCDLANVDLRGRDLTGADLSGANLNGATLHRAILRGANLTRASLVSANLNLADLSQADFEGADLFNVLLFHSTGSGGNFAGTDLRAALAGEANMPLADFTGALMNNADFRMARLNDAILVGVNLMGANLAQTVFTRANLANANLDGAYAFEAMFRGTDLRGASLRTTELGFANLSNADLTGADFSGANLLSANLTEAIREGTLFAGATMPDGSVAAE